MATTAIDSLRGILNGFRDLNSKGIYTMNATETDLLRQILIEVQALSIGGTIADGSVTTAKIADLNVTTAKIADLAISTAKLDDNSVTTGKIAGGAVGASDLSGAQTGSAPVFGVRAWVNFNGTGTVAIRASGNVSSITDNGAGDYTVSFTTAMPDADYVILAASSGALAGLGWSSIVGLHTSDSSGTPSLKTSSACRIVTFDPYNASPGAKDYPNINIAFLR